MENLAKTVRGSKRLFQGSTPQFIYNIKFSKRRSEHCERKQKRNKGNARTWVRILSFIYSGQETEATDRNIITNETPSQMFFS